MGNSVFEVAAAPSATAAAVAAGIKWFPQATAREWGCVEFTVGFFSFYRRSSSAFIVPQMIDFVSRPTEPHGVADNEKQPI